LALKKNSRSQGFSFYNEKVLRERDKRAKKREIWRAGDSYKESE